MKNNINKIKNITKDVYRELGSGHSESVYEQAMLVGLRLAKIKYESQRVVEVKYKEHYVGEEYPDIIAHFGKDRAAIELKSVGGNLGPHEEQQLKIYMQILKIKWGLLVNFQQPKKKGKSELEIREIHL